MTKYSADNTKNDKKEELILKLFRLPFTSGVTKLYKYMSLVPEKIKYLEEVFRDGEIYFPSPLKFNDPFECRPFITWYRSGPNLQKYIAKGTPKRFPGANRESRRKLVRDAMKRFQSNQDQSMKEIYERFLSNTGLYCLSEINDNILMWSHYANGHNGAVLEFNATVENSLFFEALEVHYSEEYPIVNLMEMDKPENYKNALLTKSIDWKYEKEWRIIKTPNEGGNRKYKFAKELLTGVILGAKIEQNNKNFLLKLVKDYSSKVNIYRANINDKLYKLDIEPI